MEGSLVLTAWENFYVIVGSSAAALTGLQFVVVTLISAERGRASMGDIAAFGTPTVVHFCVALFVGATLSAPWESLVNAGIAISGCGIAGTIYALVVIHRARSHARYKPVLSDWIWHVMLPLMAYLALLIDGIMLSRIPSEALFAIAASVLLLVYIGIHNAWDAVIFVTVTGLPDDEKQEKP
jgi:hypothetical protein